MTPTSRIWPTTPALPNCCILRVAAICLRRPLALLKVAADLGMDNGSNPQSATHHNPESDAGKPVRVVAIGGGTGLSTLLKGLKRYVPASGDGAAHLQS